MRFLHYFSLVMCLASSSLAASTSQANDALDNMSTILDTLQKNQDAIARYNGGIFGAVPLARVNYDTWSALRQGNADIDNVDDDTEFSEGHSDAIVQNFTSIHDKSIHLYNAYAAKASMLNQAGVGFMVPLVLEALFREGDDYMTALRGKVTPNHVPAMNQITVDNTAIWKSTFQIFEDNRISESSQNYKKLFSAITPFLGFLV
ncbi:hypothetical protein N7490_000745 [Penicillium lividum]|nr:hypothetical protein N7490_000745 [Penicillium lividum]